MLSNQNSHGVVLMGKYKDNWARTVVTALARVGVVPITILAIPGVSVVTAPFNNGVMELTFHPVGLKARVKVVVTPHEEALGYITLVAVLPDDEEPLCSMYVPRGEGWRPLAEVLSG